MMIFSTEGLLGQTFDRSVIDDPTSSSNKKIRAGFNEIIDMTDLYYNPKIGEVVKRIAIRFENDGRDKFELKQYITKLVGKLYRDLEPRTGMYASSQKELEEADKNYAETLNKLQREFTSRGI
jgi:hypothetical protein